VYAEVSEPAYAQFASAQGEVFDLEGRLREHLYFDGRYVDQLYVLGRNDDYIVLNGRKLFAPDIEQRLAREAGTRPGRTAVFGVPTGDVVVVAERAESTASPRSDTRLRTRSRTRSRESRAADRATSSLPSRVTFPSPPQASSAEAPRESDT
jgi:hypothetical protein